MFTPSVDVLSGTDFSELGEDNEFTWHQFHVKGWVAQDFEGQAPMAVHNATGCAVPLTWLLFDSQSTGDMIVNPKILLTIRKMRYEDDIRVHCNIGVKIVDRVGDLPGYVTVWYKPTWIANTLSMSRPKKKFGTSLTARAGMF